MKSNNKIIYIIGMISLLSIIVYWIMEIKQGKLPIFDQWNQKFVPLFANTWVYTMFRYITEFGSKSFVLPMTMMMTIVLWIWYKNYKPACIFALGTLGTHLLNKFIKEMVMRERPSISVLLNAEGYSFPSGHAMVSTVCYGLLAYFIGMKCTSVLYKRFIYWCFITLVFLIGLSRYIIHVHYLTDIITGYFIGYLILILLIQLYKRALKTERNI